MSEMGNQQGKTADCNWLAGLFDGEGCLTFQMSPAKGRTNDTFSPYISLSNTDQAILPEVVRILTELNLPHHVWHEKPQRPGYKPKWNVRATGIRRCSRWLTEFLLPYSRLKRPQVEAMARILALRAKRSYRDGYGPDEVALIMEHFRKQSKRKPSETTRLAGATAPAMG